MKSELLQSDLSKLKHDIDNLQFILTDTKTTIKVKQDCINQLMTKYRERAELKAQAANAPVASI